MGKIISALAIGAVFGLGIAISGMANPAKVLNFFDIAGTWDPSLAFVMGGALLVTAIGYQFVFRTSRRPLFESDFSVPAARAIDLPLVGGAALFGVGWGLSGFCPGGAVPALGIGDPRALIFVASMVAGMVLARAIRIRVMKPRTA